MNSNDNTIDLQRRRMRLDHSNWRPVLENLLETKQLQAGSHSLHLRCEPDLERRVEFQINN